MEWEIERIVPDSINKERDLFWEGSHLKERKTKYALMVIFPDESHYYMTMNMDITDSIYKAVKFDEPDGYVLFLKILKQRYPNFARFQHKVIRLTAIFDVGKYNETVKFYYNSEVNESV